MYKRARCFAFRLMLCYVCCCVSSCLYPRSAAWCTWPSVSSTKICPLTSLDDSKQTSRSLQVVWNTFSCWTHKRNYEIIHIAKTCALHLICIALHRDFGMISTCWRLVSSAGNALVGGFNFFSVIPELCNFSVKLFPPVNPIPTRLFCAPKTKGGGTSIQVSFFLKACPKMSLLTQLWLPRKPWLAF